MKNFSTKNLCIAIFICAIFFGCFSFFSYTLSKRQAFASFKALKKSLAKPTETNIARTIATKDTETFKEIIKQIPDINEIQIMSKHPLLFAEEEGSYEIMKIILASQDSFPQEVLQKLLLSAIKNNQTDLAKDIIAKAKDINELNNTSFMDFLNSAIQYKNAEIVKALADAGMDVNSPHGNSYPLFLASATTNSDIEVVKALINAGADVNAIYGKVSLLCWVIIAHKQKPYAMQNAPLIAKILVENGADINLEDPDGLTPFKCAVDMGNSEFIKNLAIASGNVEMFYPGTKTPLIMAFDRNSAIVQDFINAGANINAQDDKGNTALIFAVTYSKYDTQNENIFKERLDYIKVLIDNGIDVNIKNNKGKTALSIAKELAAKNPMHEKIVKILEDARAKE